jgi:energy-coupling factor transporter ATP-binding protein EcfA2
MQTSESEEILAMLDIIALDGHDGCGKSTLARLALRSVQRVSESGERPLVFDRHWMTMFTVLPERLWEAWGELPPTILCYADIGVVADRLLQRGEDLGDMSKHQYYLRRYAELSELCPRGLRIDTGNHDLGTCVTQVVEFLNTGRPSRPGETGNAPADWRQTEATPHAATTADS